MVHKQCEGLFIASLIDATCIDLFSVPFLSYTVLLYDGCSMAVI